MRKPFGAAYPAVALCPLILVMLYTGAFLVGSLTQRMWTSAVVSLLFLLLEISILVVFAQWVRRYDIRDKLAHDAATVGARADYEHHALLRGDIHVGVYGTYPPPSAR